jgi:hypothetical protein
MERLAALGRVAFATSLAAFGIQQFIFGDFIPGRAPAWPDGVSGRLVWAYLSGMVLTATAASIFASEARGTPAFRKAAQLAAAVTGTMIFAWAFLRHIPIAAADPQLGSAWTQLGKAMMLSGGAFAIAGSLSEPDEQAPWFLDRRLTSQTGRACLGIFMIVCGIQHFLWTPFVTTLVPAWIPGALFWTYFAGVALVAGGAGLIIPRTAALAGLLSGGMVFVWFLILHIPRAVNAPGPAELRNEWVAVFEALAVSGLAVVLAATAAAPARTAAGRRFRAIVPS